MADTHQERVQLTNNTSNAPETSDTPLSNTDSANFTDYNGEELQGVSDYDLRSLINAADLNGDQKMNILNEINRRAAKNGSLTENDDTLRKPEEFATVQNTNNENVELMNEMNKIAEARAYISSHPQMSSQMKDDLLNEIEHDKDLTTVLAEYKAKGIDLDGEKLDISKAYTALESGNIINDESQRLEFGKTTSFDVAGTNMVNIAKTDRAERLDRAMTRAAEILRGEDIANLTIAEIGALINLLAEGPQSEDTRSLIAELRSKQAELQINDIRDDKNLNTEEKIEQLRNLLLPANEKVRNTIRQEIIKLQNIQQSRAA